MRLQTLKYALSTLHEEIIQFRFDYPLLIVNEAGPKESLHYYLHKYKKTPPPKAVLRLDSQGIAQVSGRITGLVYRPAFVANYALGNLYEYLQQQDDEYLAIFLNQVDWLQQHAVIREDGAAVWPHNFDLQEGPVRLRAPWLSCNVQGLVISALVRAWRITRNPRLLELLERSSRIFELDCARNGIRVRVDGHIVYTEVPGLPAPGIMDGFMTSLLGLYDLYVEMGEPKVYQLFCDGVEGLRYFLPRWDYNKKWTVYSNREYLCPPSYHALNCVLLTVLARLTHDGCLNEYAQAWRSDRLSPLDRAEIYFTFLLTKNACRIKYRTWRQRAAEMESEIEGSLSPRNSPIVAG